MHHLDRVLLGHFSDWGRFFSRKEPSPIQKNHCFFILGFEIKEAIYPKNTAAEIPPAEAFTPPMKAPTRPDSLTLSIAPFARL